jgi:hypothetical protein
MSLVMPGPVINEATVAAFAEHLEAFVGTLTHRESAVLKHLFTSTLDPWERMRLLDPASILSPEEAELLRELERP